MSPNDLVVGPGGNVYFTDPRYQNNGDTGTTTYGGPNKCNATLSGHNDTYGGAAPHGRTGLFDYGQAGR